MQQELEARRQDLIAKERSLDQAEAAAERRWAKLTEDVSAKVQPRLALVWHLLFFKSLAVTIHVCRPS